MYREPVVRLTFSFKGRAAWWDSGISAVRFERSDFRSLRFLAQSLCRSCYCCCCTNVRLMRMLSLEAYRVLTARLVFALGYLPPLQSHVVVCRV